MNPWHHLSGNVRDLLNEPNVQIGDHLAIENVPGQERRNVPGQEIENARDRGKESAQNQDKEDDRDQEKEGDQDQEKEDDQDQEIENVQEIRGRVKDVDHGTGLRRK